MIKPSFYSSEDSILLAAMCYQTYNLFEDTHFILPEGYTLSYTLQAIAGNSEPKRESFGFIAESEASIILAFRGTDSTEDLDSDLDLFQIPYPYTPGAGHTHQGATHIYDSMRDSLITHLNTLSKDKTLYICGHSLGGVLAILSTLDIVTNTEFTNPFLYTYASGRAGTPQFVSAFTNRISSSIRIYNVHDIIPTFPAAEYPSPFTEDGLYYQHVPTDYPLYFQFNNFILNHNMNNYFTYIAKENPSYAKQLSKTTPGFCPK